ncbi:hypothetical protein GSI_14264 [Ganoderma sinense ZZ0214-1]|uniref:Uncharacterized protein n=1 Tax=Ganoderma sinense ZZ0214-1 TaxID=1077348 RepID=A0A2G8RSM4_9APHY|nr:hypothetical protein GSI_14264 [Ganoderma sinense ZZ0214-1]
MFSSILHRAPSAFRRPLSASSPSSFPTFHRAPYIPRLASHLLRNQPPVRGAASSVSGRPGSQTLEHAAENIREEVGHSAADLAKSIAGGNVYADNVEPTQQTFVRPPMLILSVRSAGDPQADALGASSSASRMRSPMPSRRRMSSSASRGAYPMCARRA